jgi:hypothetical protein
MMTTHNMARVPSASPKLLVLPIKLPSWAVLMGVSSSGVYYGWWTNSIKTINVSRERQDGEEAFGLHMQASVCRQVLSGQTLAVVRNAAINHDRNRSCDVVVVLAHLEKGRSPYIVMRHVRPE